MDTPFVFAPGLVNINTDAESYNALLHYEFGDLQQGKMETIAYYTDDQAAEKEYEQTTGRKAYKENRDAVYYGIKSTWFKKMFSVHTLSLGAEWQHDEAKNMDKTRYWDHSNGFYLIPKSVSLLTDPDERNNDYGLFIQDV